MSIALLVAVRPALAAPVRVVVVVVAGFVAVAGWSVVVVAVGLLAVAVGPVIIYWGSTLNKKKILGEHIK